MFEDRTYENIRDEMLAEFPSDIDVREGSIAYDSVSAVAAKAAMLYIDIANCYELTNLEKSSGEYLDRFASEHGVKRIMATKAIYEFIYEGMRPDDGTSFYDESGDNYFTLITNDDGMLTLVSEDTGTSHNIILAGTEAIPVDNIDGLTRAEFGKLITPAIDDEDDESLRIRIKNKISGPAENGNRSQYQAWCEEINGVGRAYIYPLAYGPNTVKAVLISPEGLPVVQSVVDEVQEYIDPMKPACILTYKGAKVILGSGYGDGKAPIGAHFVAMSANSFDISISLKIELKSGFTADEARESIKNAVTEYLKNLALETDGNKTVRYNRIGSIIERLDAVFDYYDLAVNGGDKNIDVPGSSAAVLTEVKADVAL